MLALQETILLEISVRGNKPPRGKRLDGAFSKGPDSEENWIKNSKSRKNLKKFKLLNWTSNSIHYRYNSHNFRSIEFEKPHDAIAVFGCSHTEGSGIREECRWGDVVAKELELKCYNLAIAGSGINSTYNIVNKWVPILKPKAVFIFATYPWRFDFFYKEEDIMIMLNHTMMGDSAGKRFQGDEKELANFELVWRMLSYDKTNFEHNYKKTIEAIKYICEGLNIPCVIIPCEEYFQTDPRDCLSRDLAHCGEEQNARIAQAMLKDYYNLI